MITVTLYFDPRRPRKDGTRALRLRIGRGGASAYITTGIYLLPKQWNARRARVTDHINAAQLNAAIARLMADAGAAVMQLERSAETAPLSITALRSQLEAVLFPGRAQSRPAANTFESWAARLARRAASESSRKGLRIMCAAVKRFDPGAPERPLENFAPGFVSDFVAFLRHEGIAHNTIAAYVARFGRVFRCAIGEGLRIQDPARGVRLSRQDTRHRDLHIDVLRRLLSFSDPARPALQNAARLFRLSFALCGINLHDLFTLRPPENGRFVYRRAKTGRLYSIKAEPEALADFLALQKAGALPVAPEGIDRALKNYNRHLHSLGAACGFPALTSYYARHSWASIASTVGIDKDTIAAALGHGKTVTDIYIHFDHRRIDKANRRVLDYVLFDL